MAIQYKNNAASTTTSAISSIDTSVTLAAGTGSRFPALGTGDYFYATLVSTTGVFEIVKVTARADDTLTIVRAQEGTLAVQFPANSRIELRVTAQNIIDAAAPKTTGPSASVDGEVALFDSTTGKLLKRATTTGMLKASSGVLAQAVAGTDYLPPTYSAVSVLDYIPANLHAAILDYTSTTDVTTYIQAAHDGQGSSGCSLYFPPGKYRFGSAVTLSKSGTYFSDGIGSAILETSSASAEIFTITGQFIEVRGFKYVSSVTRTSGAYINETGNRAYIRDFWMEDFFVGIVTSGTSVTIESGWMLDGVATNGVGIVVIGGADISIRDVTLDAAVNINAGVRITNGLDATIEDCNFIRCSYGLDILPTTGQTVASVWGNNTFFDNCDYGVRLDSTGGNIVRLMFDQCWFSSATNYGVLLSKSSGSPILSGVEFNDCHFYDNGSVGFYIFDPAWIDVSINGGIFAGNASTGVSVAANTNKFYVRGTRIGPYGDFGANANGIVVEAGTSDDYIITDCDLRGNTSAALTDGGTGTNKIVKDNLGVPLNLTGTLTLANGANSNLSISGATYHRITGPTGAFSISGFVAPSDARELIVHNSVAQDMTLTNDATSTAANRILTLTGADVTLTGVSAARFVYSTADSRWILVGTQG
jgi:hypothetical protein